MVVYVKTDGIYRNLLELFSKFNKFAGYKIDVFLLQIKLFLLTSTEHREIEISNILLKSIQVGNTYG